jgi:hypothetical protein
MALDWRDCYCFMSIMKWNSYKNHEISMTPMPIEQATTSEKG